MPKKILEIPNTSDLAFFMLQGKLQVGCTPDGRIFLCVLQEEEILEDLKPIPYE